MKAHWLMLILLMASLALGYVWPYHPPAINQATQADWQQLTPGQGTAIKADPALLARFFPMSKAKDDVDAKAKHNDWRLVAVIRQGKAPQALVLSPQGELLTLSKGDALDDSRTVSAVLASELHWQDAQQAGVLSLFPRPAANTSTDNSQDLVTNMTTLSPATHE